ncbi:hypothetical protein Tco_0308533 [Tanacetum coccineum]
MDDSTREIIDEDQSIRSKFRHNERPYHMMFIDSILNQDEHDILKMLGVTTPNEVVVKVPKGLRNKGCGTGGARFIGPGEKAKNKAKTKKQESEDLEQGDENDTSDHATSDTK